MSGNIKSPLDGTNIQLASDVYIGMGQSTIIPEILDNDRVMTNPIRPQPPYKSGEWADIINNQPPIVRIPEILIDRDFAMNGNTVKDLKTASASSEAVRYDQLTSLVGSGGTVNNITINDSTIVGGTINNVTIGLTSLPIHDCTYHDQITQDKTNAGGTSLWPMGNISSSTAIGERFTAGVSKQMTHCEFVITRVGNPTDGVYVSVFNTTAGVPSGSSRVNSGVLQSRDVMDGLQNSFYFEFCKKLNFFIYFAEVEFVMYRNNTLK